MNETADRLKALKGVVPSILELGDECKLCSRFNPDECACGGTEVEPSLVEINPGHYARINIELIK